MSPTDRLARPAVRERIEQTLAPHPTGMPASALRDALAERSQALGETPIAQHQLIRQLGLLLIEGRIDECDGVWVLRDERAQATDPCVHDRAA